MCYPKQLPYKLVVFWFDQWLILVSYAVLMIFLKGGLNPMAKTGYLQNNIPETDKDLEPKNQHLISDVQDPQLEVLRILYRAYLDYYEPLILL